MRRRNTVVIVWGVVIGTVLAVLFVWQYMGYQASQRVLPAGLTMAGRDVGGMSPGQAIAALESAFAQPVQLRYIETPLALAPENVEFRFDAEVTRASLDAVRETRAGTSGFIDYLLHRDTTPVDVPVQATFSVERLDGYLARIAQQYDRPPQNPVPLPNSLTFSAGQSGYQLDMAASRGAVAAALLSAEQRQADLVVEVESAPHLTLDTLRDVMLAYLGGFDGTAGVFVKQLQTGEELSINDDVAFSAEGTLRIPILLESYHLQPDRSDPAWRQQVAQMVTQHDNNASNALLAALGGGDVAQGPGALTAALQRLGLQSTFMTVPYDYQGSDLPTLQTPANSPGGIDTQPSPTMQATPAEIGLLLEAIYQCSQGGGELMLVYSGELGRAACADMLDQMAQNQIDSFIEVGLPPGTRLAHQQGWVSNAHADAGVVYSPAGDFVLVVFLQHPLSLEWARSSAITADLAKLAYNYFNPLQ